MRSRIGIIPKLVSHMWETMERPHRLLDQNFGLGLHPEQFIRSVDRFFDKMDRMDRRYPTTYYRPWADLAEEDESGYSVIKPDKDKFHVALDVQQFKPEEINVKVVDNYLVVEGKLIFIIYNKNKDFANLKMFIKIFSFKR